jgi:hypothetical protein
MSRGGMRWGAGRPAWHVKAEYCRQIDARRWAREGVLRQGRSGGWGWRDSESGNVVASIGYDVMGPAVTLTYSMQGRHMRQCVPILTTPCTYGSARYWFGCPRCGRRVAILYLRNAGFGCRKCCRIAYKSQSEDQLDRTWRKQSKAEAKLGPGWQRPKGMHQATRERLLATIFDCEQRREAAIGNSMARLGIRF